MSEEKVSLEIQEAIMLRKMVIIAIASCVTALSTPADSEARPRVRWFGWGPYYGGYYRPFYRPVYRTYYGPSYYYRPYYRPYYGPYYYRYPGYYRPGVYYYRTAWGRGGVNVTW